MFGIKMENSSINTHGFQHQISTKHTKKYLFNNQLEQTILFVKSKYPSFLLFKKIMKKVNE